MKLLFVAWMLLLVNVASAQIIKRKKDEVKNKSEQRVENKTSGAIDEGLNKVEEGIGSIFKKKDKKSKKKDEKNESAYLDMNPADTGDVPDFTVYKGSDFVPGKNVLFFEDFSIARLGDGKENWHLYEYDSHVDVERPNVGTIPSYNGNWLKMPRKGFVFPNSFKNLPEQFTIELDLYADPKKMNEMEGGFRVNFIAKDDREEYSIYWPTEPAIGLDVHPHGASKTVQVSAVMEYNSNLTQEQMVLFDKTFATGWNPGVVNHVSISRNGPHVILYLNGQEMLNLANGLPKTGQYNLILSTNLWGDGMYVTNIRVAGDIADAKKEIKSEGKFVTNAIYFDVNSSRIKPESWATLKQAADAINAADGNILIVGHTDSDGNDDLNLALSAKRAEAVKSALVMEFGIAAGRLSTEGKGESEPLEPNTTSAGKAKNRRVEFIKR